MKAEPRRAVTLLRNLALSAASLLVFILLVEGILALLWHPEGGRLPPGITDAYVGFRLRPLNTWREAGGAIVRTNTHGFRDREIAPSPPSGGLRVLCVGDSSTFGYGVRPDETYVKRLERLLRARFPGRSVEVINAGTPGWDSANGAAFLAREGLAWKPDVVLISFGYNEQLGAGPGAPHYDYDPWLRRVWFHPLGESVRTLVSAPTSEETPRREGFLDRFRHFPFRLGLYRLMTGFVRGAEEGTGCLLGWIKGNASAHWIVRKLYERDPELVQTRLYVSIRSNHVVEAYTAHLEAMVRMSREAGAQPVILLQPRKAYREFLDLLPEKERRANLKAVAFLLAGKPRAAIPRLEAQRAARPRDAITLFNLAVAYRMAGMNTDAEGALTDILPIRSFTMNVLAERTAARLGVPVVYTPLAFEASDAPHLFFPDRYHTRPAGYAIVAPEVEKVLLRDGLLGKREAVGNPVSSGSGGARRSAAPKNTRTASGPGTGEADVRPAGRIHLIRCVPVPSSCAARL